MLGLRCSCRECGAQAKIEVTWAPQSQNEHRNLGMSTAILAWAPQSWHEHHNLGMSIAILAWAPQSQHRGSPLYAIFQHPHCDVLVSDDASFSVSSRSRCFKSKIKQVLISLATPETLVKTDHREIVIGLLFWTERVWSWLVWVSNPLALGSGFHEQARRGTCLEASELF